MHSMLMKWPQKMCWLVLFSPIISFDINFSFWLSLNALIHSNVFASSLSWQCYATKLDLDLTLQNYKNLIKFFAESVQKCFWFPQLATVSIIHILAIHTIQIGLGGAVVHAPVSESRGSWFETWGWYRRRPRGVTWGRSSRTDSVVIINAAGRPHLWSARRRGRSAAAPPAEMQRRSRRRPGRSNQSSPADMLTVSTQNTQSLSNLQSSHKPECINCD